MIMGMVVDRLGQWGRENNATLENLEGGHDFFNWLNNENNELLNAIVEESKVGVFNMPSESAIKADLQYLLDTATENGNSTAGLKEAYKADPEAFMQALQSRDDETLKRMIEEHRPETPSGPEVAQPGNDQPEDPEDTVEDGARRVAEDEGATPQQRVGAAELLGALFDLKSGDGDMDNFLKILGEFIEMLFDGKFDDIGNELAGARDEMTPDQPETAPEPEPEVAPATTPEPAANQPASAPAGPGM